MSLYYILNTEDYSGDISEIGNIMSEFTTELYNSTGLNLGIYLGPTTEESQNYMGENKLTYLTEEVLWKNLSDDERIEKINKYVTEIAGDIRDELIIIDPYLFRSPKDNEEVILENVLTRCKFKNILTIVEKDHSHKDYIRRIAEKLDSRLRVEYSDEFHDRFWIANRNKGFITGTSLNGIGKKYCVIQKMDELDVSEIIKILIDGNLIEG